MKSLCCFVRGGAMWNFRFFGLLLLTRWGRILKLSILRWLGDWRGYFLLTSSRAWSSYGWREKGVFRLSQLGGSINPCSVECFFPSLSAVRSTHSRDLCPEGLLSLSYADVIAMLLSLILFTFSLGFCFLCLSFSFFYFLSLWVSSSCFLRVASCSLVATSWSLASSRHFSELVPRWSAFSLALYCYFLQQLKFA